MTTPKTPGQSVPMLRILIVFIGVTAMNYWVAHDDTSYLRVVLVGNMQIVAFYLFALFVETMFRATTPRKTQ